MIPTYVYLQRALEENFHRFKVCTSFVLKDIAILTRGDYSSAPNANDIKDVARCCNHREGNGKNETKSNICCFDTFVTHIFILYNKTVDFSGSVVTWFLVWCISFCAASGFRAWRISFVLVFWIREFFFVSRNTGPQDRIRKIASSFRSSNRLKSMCVCCVPSAHTQIVSPEYMLVQ